MPIIKNIPYKAPAQPQQQQYNNWFNPAPAAWNPALPPPNITPITGVTRAPQNQQFPGSLLGAPWKDVVELIRKQKKAKGVFITSVINTITTVPVQLSGTAKIFLGLKIGSNLNLASPDATVKLVINDEVIFQDVSTFFLSNDFALNSCNTEYFSYPRPLAGNDSIQLTVSEPAAGVGTLYEFCFFYL